jgi:hypothetical protein
MPAFFAPLSFLVKESGKCFCPLIFFLLVLRLCPAVLFVKPVHEAFPIPSCKGRAGHLYFQKGEDDGK